VDELSEFLGNVELFEELDDPALDALACECELISVPAGSTVIEMGETGDSLYVVDSGRLRVSTIVHGSEIVLRELSRGEVVGEMALLGRRPRSATVRAVRDSQLLRLTASSFQRLVETRPSVLYRVVQMLVHRLATSTTSTASDAPRALTIAPAGRDGGAGQTDVLNDIAHALNGELATSGPVRLLDSAAVDSALGPGAAGRAPGDPGWGELLTMLHALERDHRNVVYRTDHELTPWTSTCLRQADRVLFVGSQGPDASPNAIEIAMASAPETARCELVLVRPPSQEKPEGTRRWLENRSVARHHHVRRGSSGDMSRLARVVHGRAAGLVLGGGGPRGLAHLGVIRALEEKGIPIDAVGGTSIGALIGALYASGLSHEERVRHTLDATTRRRRLVDLTLPVLSLASGRNVTRLLEEEFGTVQVEDLPISYFCVSADLTTASQVTHERGDLWRAVRASLSMPAIFPPVYDDGHLLVDGAVLNNLPVDSMRRLIMGGPLVAVDLLPEIERLPSAPFGPAMSGWRALASVLRGRFGSSSVPDIMDVITRSNALAGVRAQKELLDSYNVDLYLRPPTPRMGAFDFDKAVPLIDLSYRYTLTALESSDFVAGATGAAV
jgi:predicted acylesterase/phospholipase RssA/CRP-like cAMP-binding protein